MNLDISLNLWLHSVYSEFLSLPCIFISGFDQLAPGIEILRFLKGYIPLVNRS